MLHTYFLRSEAIISETRRGIPKVSQILAKHDQRGSKSHLVDTKLKKVRLIEVFFLMFCNREREGGRGNFTVVNSRADVLSALHAFSSSWQRFERKSMKRAKKKTIK